MTDAYAIRRARQADAAPLGALWQRFMDEQAALDARLAVAPDALARWHNDFPLWLGDEMQRLFVAERKGQQISGFLAAARWGPPPVYAPAAEVYVSELYVLPEARRQGVGRALVEAVRRWAVEDAGAVRLRLRTLAANKDARSFWNQAGAISFATTLTVELPGGDKPRRGAPPSGKAQKPRFGF